MTGRCAPPPELRVAGSWHLLRLGRAYRTAVWVDYYGDGTGTVWTICGVGSMGQTFAHDRGYQYVSPIYLPDGSVAMAEATP